MSQPQLLPPYTLPAHFHHREMFDYESLNERVFRFVDMLVAQRGFVLTSLFLNEDEEGRKYSSYRIPEYSKKPGSEKFKAVASLLEEARIYLDSDDSKAYLIYDMFHEFYGLTANQAPLTESNLEAYLKETHADFYPEQVKKNRKNEISVQDFKTAEQVMLKLWPRKSLKEKTTFFLPIPILSAGELRGSYFIVYDKTQLSDVFKSLNNIYGLLCQQITGWYEDVVLGRNLTYYQDKPNDPLDYYLKFSRHSGIKYTADLNIKQVKKNEEGLITKSPFLMSLKYHDYYRRDARILVPKIKNVVKASRSQIRSAISSIIVDSFAHNVGAHALVALKWFFENRFKSYNREFAYIDTELHLVNSEKLRDKARLALYAQKSQFDKDFAFSDSSHTADHITLYDVIQGMDNELQEELLLVIDQSPEEVKALARLPIPVDHGLYRFFEYLRDKSAFWSGVARDSVFSGRIRTWESLLRDFLSNTLFLGTITNSEGINRVNFHLEIVEKGEVKVSGKFVEINLDVIKKEEMLAHNGQASCSQTQSRYSDYAFFREGKDYETLIGPLRELESVFLPNGVIGQQALYTILENTLRNIKHYRDLESIRKTGVNLFLSIESVPFIRLDGTATHETLFKVGAWLHHPQQLLNEEGCFKHSGEEINPDIGAVIHSHSTQLRMRVVNRDGKPTLGGSSQDKICASMLMNNTFISIDEIDRDKVKVHYFPYVYAATEKWTKASFSRPRGYLLQDEFLHKTYNEALRHENNYIRHQKYIAAVESYLQRHQMNDKGLIKKFFHLWKGEACKVVTEEFVRAEENLSRFRIVAVDAYQGKDQHGNPKTYTWGAKLIEDSSLYALRNQGNLRVVQATQAILTATAELQYQLAMRAWLRHWLGYQRQPNGFILTKPAGNTVGEIGIIYLSENDQGDLLCEYANQVEMDALAERKQHGLSNEIIDAFPKINLAHSTRLVSENIPMCRTRSHGALMKEFFANYTLNSDEESKKDLADAVIVEFDKRAKLIETLYTSIAIFDNRLHGRLSSNTTIKQTFETQMRLAVYEELAVDFFDYRNRVFSQANLDIHFLIVHLSFLESIPLDKGSGKTYSEAQVQRFFEKEIVQYYLSHNEGAEFPENFLFVITSGRGRGDWFNAIEHPQITFRPIEALTDAIEDGLSIRDDFQVKYNLCNVLFGS